MKEGIEQVWVASVLLEIWKFLTYILIVFWSLPSTFLPIPWPTLIVHRHMNANSLLHCILQYVIWYRSKLKGMVPTLKEGQVVDNRHKMIVYALCNSVQNFHFRKSSEARAISKG